MNGIRKSQADACDRGWGVTYSYNDNTMRQKATGVYLIDAEGGYMRHDLETFFADAIFKYKGISVSTEYARKGVLQTASDNTESTNLPSNIVDANNKSYLTGSGVNLQLAYLFKCNFELGARVTKVFPDKEYSFKELTEYTLGLSQYFNGHKLKVQGDISYTDFAANQSGKIRYRLQLEVAF